MWNNLIFCSGLVIENNIHHETLAGFAKGKITD